MNNQIHTAQDVLDFVNSKIDDMPLDYVLTEAAKKFGLTFKEVQELLEREFKFYSGI